MGLTARYKDDAAFNCMVRRASALPLVPPDSVHDVWLDAMNEVVDEEADKFKDYMVTTWIDEYQAKFPIEVWTQYDNIAGIRTNNDLEGWHSSLNKELSRAHPNVYALIEILKFEQRRFEMQLRGIMAGDAPPTQRPIYRRITERLVRLNERLLANDITIYH